MTKRTGKFVKAIVATLLVALTATLGISGYMSYIGGNHVSADVPPYVQMNGGVNTVSEVYLEDVGQGCCVCVENVFEMNPDACEGDWIHWWTTAPEAIPVSVYLKDTPCILQSLEISALDGIATDDSFEVYIDDILVYTYDDQTPPDNEIWRTHDIDVSMEAICCCSPHTIKIEATGEKWSGFDSYGQLAIDYIAMFNQQGCCDAVDIGEPTSEATHSLNGWGPIEPMASGGAYGGINDCRCTWYNVGDAKMAEDQPWATVVMQCPECQGGECDCEHDSLEHFWMNPGDTVVVCECYYIPHRWLGPFSAYTYYDIESEK